MDTPVISWSLEDGLSSPLWLKLEGHNPSGSIKDRLAAHVLATARAQGLVPHGTTVIEVSTGNTGVALSRVTRLLGLRCEVLLPASVRPSLIQRVRDYGGVPVLLPDELGPENAMRQARRRVRDGCYWPDQAHNPVAREAYVGLASALVRQIPSIDCLICGVGTGGTLLGLMAGIRDTGRPLHVVGVHPHRGEQIEGLRPASADACGPDLYRPSLCSEVVHCTRDEAEHGRRLLAVRGIRCGASGGAVFEVAMAVARRGVFRGVVGICADGVDTRCEGGSST